MGGNIFRCCGKTAKPASRVVAYIDLTIAFICLLSGLLLITSYPGYFLARKGMEPSLTSTPNIVLIIIFIAVFFVECCLSALLLSAAKHRNVAYCENWFKIRLVCLCIFIFALIYALTASQRPVVIFIVGSIGLVYILYRVYSLMIVRFFQNEIENKIKIAFEIVDRV